MIFRQRSFVFISICLFITCMAKMGRERTYDIEGLSADKIDVDIQSEIPGQITWILTDDHNFRLKVNIEAEDENAIDNVDIDLAHTNASVKLLVRERYFSIAHAPVTGTGNTVTIPAFLVWLLALMINWNNPVSMSFIMLACGFAAGTAEVTYDFPKKTVNIEVKAPRRLSYDAVNLSINGGKLRVVNWERQKTAELTCKTSEIVSRKGCSNCCNGNGVCVENHCICDKNYDDMSDCASSNIESVLFSHPMDPRFDRTFLQNDDILTLGRALQFAQQEAYLKYPDKYALEIKSRDPMLPRVLVIFHSNGVIEKLVYTKSSKDYFIKFKRSRMNQCTIRLKGNLVNREINVCGTNNEGVKNVKNEFRLKENEELKRTVNKESTKMKRRHKHMYSLKNEFKVVELPVRIHRCGYNSKLQKYVYFKIFKDNYIDSSHESISRSNSNISFLEDENIFLLSHKTLYDTEVLRFPEYSFPLGSKEITQRCEMTKSLHRKICSANLKSLGVICDDLSNHTGLNISTPTQFSESIYLCKHVLKTVSSYCNKHYSNVLTQDKSCLTQFTNSLNLFSTETYLLQPFVIFPDDKLIPGKVQHVNFGSISQLNSQSTELLIVEDNAEFKIVKISVIPKDPVPHDIYQVKLEYACATSETVIKMTVYGSDFYTNSVTCRGITHCNCCILHAAGAPNAVVDRVTINVTDSSRNYQLNREMVVVF